MTRPRLVALLLPLAACSAAAPRLTRDADLRGREIVVLVQAVPGGYRLYGRLLVAVPPSILAALSSRPRTLVRLFANHVAGAGRWPHGREERFFFAAKLFGRVFRSWGHVARDLDDELARIRWRTDRGAHGAASAKRRGSGSEVTFDSFFPSKTDLARFLPRFGVEVLLKIVAFAVRARIEQLWRDRLLPRAPGPERASYAGIAPREPSPRGPRPRAVIGAPAQR